MVSPSRRALFRRIPWTTAVPMLAQLAFAAVLIGVVLLGAVLAAVHHSELVAHRVGSRSGRWSSPSR